MTKLRRRYVGYAIWWMRLVLSLLFLHADSRYVTGRKLEENNVEVDFPSQGVLLLEQDNYVIMSNGIVSLNLTVPDGEISSITYKGGDNLIQSNVREDQRGNWDVVWHRGGEENNVMKDFLVGTKYRVIMKNEIQTELSFSTIWSPGSDKVPLNVDKRFVMLRGSSGFYSYAVLEKLRGWPAFSIPEGRMVFKLDENKFHYMAVSDDIQRFMPMPEDRLTGQTLDYKEAVLLTNPRNPEFKGEVDDKYFYSIENKDNTVHGWASNNSDVGFWMITPSNEFRTGGPFKQDLTSHVGSSPTVLSMFISRHYAGEDLALNFEVDEYWKKVLGPVFIYLNSNPSDKTNPSGIWNDAKQRMEREAASWPYSFPLAKDFVRADGRGEVSGQLFVRDGAAVNKRRPVTAAAAYVGIVLAGAAGSWQLESKGYQFWTQTDNHGNFMIKNVIPGNYSLVAWVPGYLGDYKYPSDIVISPGTKFTARNVVFESPRNGPTLWEIGIPDRSAAEFFIPDPDPKFKIHKYKSSNPDLKFKQYGLWARYADLYPERDLVFTTGTSNYRKDWFFAHVTRKTGGGEIRGTTWQIVFNLSSLNRVANYTLQLALASANEAELQVRINDPNSLPLFTTGFIGKDNAVARHGIHGLYHFYSITIEGDHLVVGRNTIFLTQAIAVGLFQEVMYDYIRLEGPA